MEDAVLYETDFSFQLYGLFHPGRCGSTLLCQMYYKMPGTLVSSDHCACGKVMLLYHEHRISRNVAANLIRDIIRIQCKPLQNVTNYFI